MSFLYDFPKQAAFGRMLPKSKIYEHASTSSKIKELFVRQVEKITWSYKLSPETINLPAKNGVYEIQVFTVALKTAALKHEVLQAIDKAIPSPILFVLTFANKTRYIAAYKRKSETDKNKWVVSSYFETNWLPDDTEKVTLPVVLDLDALYQSMLTNLIPIPARQNETLGELVSRVERLQIKGREAEKLDTRMKKEKQFNRKVEFDAELRGLKQEIEELNRQTIT